MTEGAPRSACGAGSMDDDEHALICIACNIARWNEVRRNERLRRAPKPPLRRFWNRITRALVLGDPTFLPTDEEGTRYGRVQRRPSPNTCGRRIGRSRARRS